MKNHSRSHLAAIMILAALLFTPGLASGQSDDERPPAHDLLRERFEQKLAERVASMNGAFGVFIKDLKSGDSFGIHQDLVLTQASSIKIPVLVELFKQAIEDKLSLETTITVSRESFVGGSGVLSHLTPGQVSMPIRDLAVLMIVLSDNTATNMLIELVGMENINSTMRELGLPNTRVQRLMMDSEARLQDRENISTPAEAARLLELLYRKEILDAASCDEILGILAIPKTSRRINGKLPEGVTVINKPGSVGGVCNDVGIVMLENRPFIVSAMTSWGADRDEAEEAIADVAYLAYEYFDRVENFNRYGHRK